jgi:flagellar FliJ protein
MPQFRYRLATLLRLRQSARDEKRAHLAEAYRAAQVLEERLAETEAEIADARRAAAEGAKPGAINVDQLVIAHRYELVLKAQRHVIVQQQQQVAQEVERRRLALVEADRQVRVLEKLREKQHEEHVRQEERRDQKLMDELAARARPQLGEVLP